MAPKKQLSGAQKRNKRKHDAQIVESQRGALHKFFVGSSNVDVNEVEGQGHESDHGQHESDHSQHESDHGQQEYDQNLNAEVQVNEDDDPMEEEWIAKIEAMEDNMNQENLHPSSDHENFNGDE
jgi:hypothetical protein